MPKILFKLYAFLREAAEAREIEIETNEEITLKEALESLSEKTKGNLHRYLFKDNGEIRESLVFVVNGKSVKGKEIEDLKLKDDTQIAIFPPFSGGRI